MGNASKAYTIRIDDMTHIDYILRRVPDLGTRTILDLGAGRGAFLLDAAARGFTARGVEYSSDNITRAVEEGRRKGVSLDIQKGAGEALPFSSESFSFVNVAEVLEHVQDPEKVLGEIARVLIPGGIAYVSIPNRFGWMDPHFHLRGVNWLPRMWVEWHIGIRGKYKQATGISGFQKLSEMHYMTKKKFTQLCKAHGLLYSDTREKTVRSLPLGWALLWVYRAYAFFFISTFHGFVIKDQGK